MRGPEEISFNLAEETDRHPHTPTARELADAARYSVQRVPEWDRRASGRLRIKLDGHRGKRGSFADGVRQSLDDQLGEVFKALESSFDALDAATLERQLEAEQRQRQYDLAVLQARARVRQDQQAAAAAEQTTRWRLAGELRAYASALRVAQADEETQAWASWIAQHAEQIDPVRTPQHRPPERTATYQEMAPYLPQRW